MTDKIDLDEMDVDSDDGPEANKGDWFWRGEGDPEAEPDEGWLDDAVDTDESETETDEERDHDPLPGVPRQNRDRPVGIPVEGGGAGGEAVGPEETDDAASEGPAASGSDSGEVWDETAVETDTETGSIASGPHGGGVDDMTMALSYDAAKRLEDPRLAVLEAKEWTDWIGIVGDVPAHTINKFQRDHTIDVDFFSGSSQGPAERLADIDEHSMFFAERMVFVGVDGEQDVASQADWEFVHIETAAEKADWDLSDPA